MPLRVFGLLDVSQDEADGVRNALAEANVEFYETPQPTPGFGFKSPADPAIWVSSDQDAKAAQSAIEHFQSTWTRNARRGAWLSQGLQVTRSTVFKWLFLATLGLLILWVVFGALGSL
jgi:hypothetical protein